MGFDANYRENVIKGLIRNLGLVCNSPIQSHIKLS